MKRMRRGALVATCVWALSSLGPASDAFAQPATEITLSDLRGLFRSPDRSVAVALAKQVVLALDGASGKEMARLTDFISPDAIVFEKAGPPATNP